MRCVVKQQESEQQYLEEKDKMCLEAKVDQIIFE